MGSRRYWQARDGFRPADTAHLTPLHESLHCAVAYLLGGWCTSLWVRENGRGEAGTRGVLHGWQNTAVTLAPVLINDVSSGDEEWLQGRNVYQRGYAYRWLKENRSRVMRLARRIEREVGDTPGALRFKRTYRIPKKGEMRWVPKRKRRSHVSRAGSGKKGG